MGFKDANEKREYQKAFMKRKRENERATALAANIKARFSPEETVVEESPPVLYAATQSGDMKDLIIANLLEQVAALKAENQMLRNGYVPNAAMPVFAQAISMVTVPIKKTKPLLSIEVFTNQVYQEAKNITDFKTELIAGICDSDVCRVLSGIDVKTVISDIFKRALSDANTRPIHRHNNHYALKNAANEWTKFNDKEFNETFVELWLERTVHSNLQKMYNKIMRSSDCKASTKIVSDNTIHTYKGHKFDSTVKMKQFTDYSDKNGHFIFNTKSLLKALESVLSIDL